LLNLASPNREFMRGCVFLNRLNLVLFCLIVISYGCGKTDIGVSKEVPNCFDNIQNQGELSVDCGGPCQGCPSKMTANIDGVAWESAGSVTSITNGNSILILSGNGNSNLSLIYTGPFETGIYNLGSASYSITTTQTNYISNTGTITFYEWNEEEEQVSGTFSFNAFESTGSGDTIRVTQGQFLFVPYQP